MGIVIDRVAKAIYHGTPRNKPWEQLQPTFKAYWHKRARAAIEAMRIPDHGQKLTFANMSQLQNYVDVQRQFNAVIDAALSE